MKIRIRKEEVMREIQRGYQKGVATLCIEEEDLGKEVIDAYVVIMASSNWNQSGTIQLLDISDTTGGGGYIAGVLDGDYAISGIPYYDEEVLEFWDSEGGEEARRKYMELWDNGASKKEWEKFIEDYEHEFFTLEDAEDDILRLIEEDLERVMVDIERLAEYEVEWI